MLLRSTVAKMVRPSTPGFGCNIVLTHKLQYFAIFATFVMTLNSNTDKPVKGKAPTKKATSPAKKNDGKMETVAKMPTGFSPVRENVKMAPTDMRDSFWIDTINGGYFEVIFTRAWQQQETENNDAYWPFFTGLAQDGNGYYTVSYIR